MRHYKLCLLRAHAIEFGLPERSTASLRERTSIPNFSIVELATIEANRRNALRSTACGRSGKQRARANALRHGLSGETVITVLEDAEEQRAFEAKLISDYDPRTILERELVVRLASLAWRLRRTTAIETGLLQMQAETVQNGTDIVEPQRASNIMESNPPFIPRPG